jgi:hypothetical protein
MFNILFNTELIKQGTDITHSTVTNPDRFTAATTGTYFIHYMLACDTTDNNSALQAQVRINDTSVISGSYAQQNTSSAANCNSIQGTFLAELTAAQYVCVQALKSSAGENWDANNCYFVMFRIA